jgi:hypothetical protein
LVRWRGARVRRGAAQDEYPILFPRASRAGRISCADFAFDLCESGRMK